MEELWNHCLTLLKKEIDNPGHLSLISSLQGVPEGEKNLCLYARDQWAYNKIDDELSARIRSCLNRLGGNDVVVSLKIANKKNQSINGKNGSSSGSPNGPNFKKEFTFTNFVRGHSNEMAYEVCYQISKPSTHYQHLLICGGVGLGKTHLMQSIGNEINRTQPNQSVMYFHAEFFTNQAVAAMRERKADAFVDRIRKYDCLLLDDIQFFVGKAATQELILHTLDHFIMNNKKFVVVCDKYPKSIKGIDPRLQSRLCSFVSTVVEPPDKPNRIEILKRKAKTLKLQLKDSDIEYIADNISSNVRELEGALKRISSLVHFCGKKANTITVREALQDIISSNIHSITIDGIVKSVAEYYSVSCDNIVSSSRLKKIAQARHVSIYLCKQLTRESVAEIGNFFGGRDHTTVRHSFNKIKNETEKNPKLEQDIHQIRNLIIN